MALCAKLLAEGVTVYAVTHPGSARAALLPQDARLHVVPCDAAELAALPELILPAAYPSGTTPAAASGKAAAHEDGELSSPKLSLIAPPRAARKLDFSGSSADVP